MKLFNRTDRSKSQSAATMQGCIVKLQELNTKRDRTATAIRAVEAEVARLQNDGAAAMERYAGLEAEAIVNGTSADPAEVQAAKARATEAKSAGELASAKLNGLRTIMGRVDEEILALRAEIRPALSSYRAETMAAEFQRFSAAAAEFEKHLQRYHAFASTLGEDARFHQLAASDFAKILKPGSDFEPFMRVSPEGSQSLDSESAAAVSEATAFKSAGRQFEELVGAILPRS